jgi:hypothetical protein
VCRGGLKIGYVCMSSSCSIVSWFAVVPVYKCSRVPRSCMQGCQDIAEQNTYGHSIPIATHKETDRSHVVLALVRTAQQRDGVRHSVPGNWWRSSAFTKACKRTSAARGDNGHFSYLINISTSTVHRHHTFSDSNRVCVNGIEGTSLPSGHDVQP